MDTATLIDDTGVIDLTFTGPELEAMLTECSRYLLTSVAAAGEAADAELRAVTVDRIRRLGRAGYGPVDLDRDLADDHIGQALDSALSAVAGGLDEGRRDALLADAVAVARSGDGPSPAQCRRIADAALALGVGPLRARLLTDPIRTAAPTPR